MTTSEKSPVTTESTESKLERLQREFIQILTGLGVGKIEDIPVGSHKQPEKPDHDVWIIK